MTMQEWEDACSRDESTPVVTIRVKEHKGDKPAKLTASGMVLSQLTSWTLLLRPLYLAGASTYVFPRRDGSKLCHLSRLLGEVAKQFSLSLPTPTTIRKAIATKGTSFTDAERAALAQTMSHSQQTAEKYYRAKTEAVNRQGYEVLGKILDVPTGPSPKKRIRFTKQQNEVIKAYFAAAISMKIVPQRPTLEKFLEENRELFPGRDYKDIYSKIRNLYGR